MDYAEVIKLPTRRESFTYGIYEGPDGAIYNVDHRTQKILYIRYPHSVKFRLGDIVLVSPEGEYAEVIDIKQDGEWGNHEYDVEFFNKGLMSYRWRDESDLQLTT